MNLSFAWDEKFPKGYGHTSIAFLKRCPGYEDAKNGDPKAAWFVVNRCIKRNRIIKLRDRYPDSILLPILGKNQLPLALAEAIGLSININVCLVHIVSRKFLCAMQRLIHKPTFIGNIERNSSYIIVDDVITQGGTIAALREFIMIHGGKVVAIVALAYSIGSHNIAPTEYQIVRILVKFGTPIINLLQTYGISNTVRELTYSQIKYLLRFSSIKNIEKRINHFTSQKDLFNNLNMSIYEYNYINNNSFVFKNTKLYS